MYEYYVFNVFVFFRIFRTIFAIFLTTSRRFIFFRLNYKQCINSKHFYSIQTKQNKSQIIIYIVWFLSIFLLFLHVRRRARARHSLTLYVGVIVVVFLALSSSIGSDTGTRRANVGWRQTKGANATLWARPQRS